VFIFCFERQQPTSPRLQEAKAADVAIQPFLRAVRPGLAPDLFLERGEREHVGAGLLEVIDHGGQRRVASTGVFLVAGQRVSLGRAHAHQTVTVHASETTLMIEFDDGETRLVRRTTTQPVRSIKGQRPRTTTNAS
jgi:hypothetical protein